MSQHDGTIANQSHTSFRSDLNAALAALFSNHSGASAPSTTYTHQEYPDTGLGVKRRRNAANSAWLVVDTIDETRVVSRSSNTLLDTSDRTKLFIATATFTQTLDAAATLADYWWCAYRVQAGATITFDPNGAETIDGAATKKVVGPSTGFVFCNGTAFFTIGFFETDAASIFANVFDARLTLTSGTPVTTADVTAAETIYLTPFRGNRIALYDGVNWRVHALAEISADVPDVTGMHDVFVYDNAGTLTLDVVAWTNDTTRATALALQDGVYVKTGATGRRYAGSFYCTTAGNGQTEDSEAKRYLWSAYHRARKPFKRTDATDSWTYTTVDAYRQANADAANQVEIVQGLSEHCITAEVRCMTHSNNASGIFCGVGIGIDSSTVNSAQVREGARPSSGAADFPNVSAYYRGYPGIGRRQLRWLEEVAGTTVTFYGDAGDVDGPASQQSGLIGDGWF